MALKNQDKSGQGWIIYFAQIITLFFALIVLTGRIYAQNYWSVFGLTPDIINTTFIDYAIMSPNTTLSSLFLAFGTVIMIAFLLRGPYYILGDQYIKFYYFLGIFLFVLGIVIEGLILKINSSGWTPGMAGMIFGLGYVFTIGGILIGSEASFKWEKQENFTLSKALKWLRYIPFILFRIVFIIAIISTSLWSIFGTAEKFGANEAKFMYDEKPMVDILLDSSQGFENLSIVSNNNGATLCNVKIITESGGLLYVSPGIFKTSQQLQVQAIPVSRIRAIQYEVSATPIGE